jgi:hypothetical protein
VSAVSAITGTPQEARSLIIQNGYKLRTICGECNSRIGREYDPTIGKLCAGVNQYLKSPLTLPAEAAFDTIPTRLVRGLLSHILASKLQPNKNLVNEQVRAYLKASPARLHPSLHLYYWLYPYAEISVTNDVGLLLYDGGPQEHGLFTVMKFSPIALVLTNVPRFPGIPDLCQFAEFGMDDPGRVFLRFDNVRPQAWPEGEAILLGGQSMRESVSGRPRDRIRR